MWEESWKITPPPLLLDCGLEKLQLFRATASLLTFCLLRFDSCARHGGALRPAALRDQIFISDSCLQRRVEVRRGGGGLARPLPEVRH